jgi:hypothetical protein
MSEQPKYFDTRSEFWRRCFVQADDYDTYLSQSDKQKADRWHELAGRLPQLGAEQAARLNGFNRAVNVLLYSGVWCGDCVRQGPMIRQLTEAAGEQVSLRIIERGANDELVDELRIVGAQRVPIVVFLTEDFWEIGRFGDRLLSTYRRKAQRDLGASCPVAYATPTDELAAERDEWLDIFERMLLMARLSPPLRQRHGD